ncbi:hypothetical protein H9P43_007296 [Blastocladiella emersonii ATCC 22665]|nr:hypothetical protein H9P43_007296 [Blastocladiella emersonii ATCC 22665]
MASTNVQVLDDVQAAVAAATLAGAVLVVALEQPASQDMTEAAREGAVSLAPTPVIVLRLEAGGAGAAMFGQVYPVNRVPALYVLRQGLMLDTVFERSEVADRLARVQQSLTSGAAPVPVPSATTAPVPSNISATATATAPAAAPVPVPVASPPAAPARPAAASSPAPASVPQPQHVPPPAAAAPRPSDASRPTSPHAAAPAPAAAPAAAPSPLSSRRGAPIRSTTSTDAAYLREVRDQIAQDRANRAAAAAATSSASTPATPPRTASSPDLATVQLAIRQLDGSVIRTTFPATDAVSAVTDWIRDNAASTAAPVPPYSLVQTYPIRRVLWTPTGVTEDGKGSLGELGLAPSATVVMRPSSIAASGSRGVAGPSAIAALFAWIAGLFGWLWQFVTGFASSSPAHDGATDAKDHASSAASSSATPAVEAERIRQRRLQTLADLQRRQSDSGDGPVTSYNGNSTSHEE